MTPGRYDSIISFYVTPEVLRELEARKLVEFVGDYKPGTDLTGEYRFTEMEMLNEGMAIALRNRDERIKIASLNPTQNGQ